MRFASAMALTFNHRAAPPWDMTGGMRGSPFGGVLGSPVDELEDQDIQLAIQASIKEEEVRVSSLCAVLGWVAGPRCLDTSLPKQRELTLFDNTTHAGACQKRRGQEEGGRGSKAEGGRDKKVTGRDAGGAPQHLLLEPWNTILTWHTWAHSSIGEVWLRAERADS